MKTVTNILDLQEFSALFRVTEKAVRDWIKRGMPVVSIGTRGGGKRRDKTRINLTTALPWYLDTNRGRLEAQRQQTRLASERADQIAMENAQRRQDLASADLMASEFATAVTYAERVLYAIPKREASTIAAEPDPAAIQAHLTDVIHAALHELANYGTASSTK